MPNGPKLEGLHASAVSKVRAAHAAMRRRLRHAPLSLTDEARAFVIAYETAVRVIGRRATVERAVGNKVRDDAQQVKRLIAHESESTEGEVRHARAS